MNNINKYRKTPIIQQPWDFDGAQLVNVLDYSPLQNSLHNSIVEWPTPQRLLWVRKAAPPYLHKDT